jgi:antitoxin component HigA of HigAB toxin-antitoxin module
MNIESMQTAQDLPDTIELFGLETMVSDVLNRKCSLSSIMICKLVNRLGVPSSIFLQRDYGVA